jgi:hypothetical protein
MGLLPGFRGVLGAVPGLGPGLALESVDVAVVLRIDLSAGARALRDLPALPV